MISYRPFRNTDPPALAEIWRAQPPSPMLAQPVSADVLERYVLSKPYFDRHGLIVAEAEGRAVGFVHAGFGPTDDRGALGAEIGVVSMLMTAPGDQAPSIAAELLARSETYLRSRGARRIFGGEASPISPFYLGLYGGSRMPGVPRSDERLQALYREAGYEPREEILIWRRNLGAFRPPIDRQIMQIRRRYQLKETADPPAPDWWTACVTAQAEQVRFELAPRSGGAPVGEAVFWTMEPLASSWGVHAMGLYELRAPQPQPGLELLLLGESLRALQGEGVTVVEAQASPSDTGRLSLLRRLGFEQVDSGVVFCKE